MMLLEEWGTSGRKRATVNDLLELLIRVELYRAADFVAKDILQETPPERPNSGPGAKIDIFLPPVEIDEEQMNERLQNIGYPDTSNLLESNASHINNVNHDYNNSIGSNDFDKMNGYASSSDDCPNMSDSQSDHETQSDLIIFSAAAYTSDAKQMEKLIEIKNRKCDRTQKNTQSVSQSDNNDGVYGSYSNCRVPDYISSMNDDHNESARFPDFEKLLIAETPSNSIDTEDCEENLPNLDLLMNGS